MKVLAVDVGGTHVKILATGEDAHREFPSGPTLTARQMVSGVKKAAAGWTYHVVAIGYPGPVLHGRPVAEPHNLGAGWVGFDYRAAFRRPVAIVNDAAMQALGSYRGGKMLFLGLGTGLGSAMIVDGIVEPMELGTSPTGRGPTRTTWAGAGRREEVAEACRGSGRAPDRRLGAGRRRSRGRQREEAEGAAGWVPGGRQRRCIPGRISPLERCAAGKQASSAQTTPAVKSGVLSAIDARGSVSARGAPAPDLSRPSD